MNISYKCPFNKEAQMSFLLNAALFISTAGTTATTLGFLSYIFQKTNSPFDTGAVTISTLVVGMFLGPFLGVLVKNKGYFVSMVIPEFLSGILLLLFIILDQVYLVYIIAFLLGLNGKVVGIARLSFVPKLTSSLVRFNAMLRAVNRLSMIVGSLIYGILVNYSLDLLFYLDALSYFLSALLLFFLHKLYLEKDAQTDIEIQKKADIAKKKLIFFKRFKMLIEGYKILFLNRDINLIVFLGIFSRFFYMALPVLLLLFIKHDLSLTDSEYGYSQTISRCASFLVFGFIAKYFSENIKIKIKPIVFYNFLIYGAITSLLYFVNDIYMLYVIYSLSELSLFSSVVFIHAYIQQILPQDKIAIASGSVSTGFSFGSICSLVVFTNLANSVSIRDLFFFIGIGLMISTLLTFGIHYILNRNNRKITYKIE